MMLRHVVSRVTAIFCIAITVGLWGCSSGPERPKPAELAPNAALMGVRQVWQARIGAVDFQLTPQAVGDRLALASSDGTVALIDGTTGRDIWRARVGEGIAAGAGTDGRTVAVVTRGNQLVALENGQPIWRHKLTAQGFTAPLVAGGRVFLLAGDRSVQAFDGRNGARLWNVQRPTEPLVLKKPGLLMAVGNQLVVGLSGRMVSINPDSGTIQWEVPLASPRGTNDVERLVDIVHGAGRDGHTVCARAFGASVGCIDTSLPQLQWVQAAAGHQGVHMDDRYVYGTESDDTVVAWRRADGQKAWSTERLRFRGLTAPLAVGRSLILGDQTGLVHVLAREDGSPLTRLTTDGSALVSAPVLVGDTLVVVTQNGSVFGYRPE